MNWISQLMLIKYLHKIRLRFKISCISTGIILFVWRLLLGFLYVCVKHCASTVKPSLVSKRELHVPVGTGPSTYAQHYSALSVCGLNRGVGSGLFMAGWGEGLSRLWTSLNGSLLFISVLMAWCFPTLRLGWLDVGSRRAWCLFIAKTISLIDRPIIKMSRNARPELLMFTVCELSAFPTWDCFVPAWIALHWKPYIRRKTELNI